MQGPIAAMFWHNEEFATGLGSDITLDAVVCVVDAVFGKQVRGLAFDTMIFTLRSKWKTTKRRTQSEKAFGKQITHRLADILFFVQTNRRVRCDYPQQS